jgi:glycosyltransferase involved in cell wall biosynthesis
MLEQITPLILTYNEAPNIARTLEQLRWAREIVVVDSFSEDETAAIANRFPQVRCYKNRFDTHEQQWNFGLKDTGINTEWVLALDADYVLTPELIAELKNLNGAAAINGYRARFVYCIEGKRLRSGIYPPVTVLYRRRHGSYFQDGYTHRLRLEGNVADLAAPILHDDRKSLRNWLVAQSRYTELEAGKLFQAAWADLTWPDRLRRGYVLAPSVMLLYCLLVRGGVLDGWAGWYYAFQRTVAELMLSLYLIKQRYGSLAQ